ncbi:MAG: hypothetical protein HXS48_23205 [Theionarchaea archaeon]|nr:hypothetical protein [Theionarchaea archaeon]
MKKKSEAKNKGAEAVHFPKKCECMPQKTVEKLQEVLKRQGIDGKLRLCKEVCEDWDPNKYVGIWAF